MLKVKEVTITFEDDADSKRVVFVRDKTYEWRISNSSETPVLFPRFIRFMYILNELFKTMDQQRNLERFDCNDHKEDCIAKGKF